MKDIKHFDGISDLAGIRHGDMFRAGIMGAPNSIRLQTYSRIHGYLCFVTQDGGRPPEYANINPNWIVDEGDPERQSVTEGGALLLNPVWMESRGVRYHPVPEDLRSDENVTEALGRLAA